MEFLRPDFESAITPVVDGDVVKIGPFTYTGAEIIRRSGDVAYKQAFDEWFWNEWVPARRERKSELLKLNSNEGRLGDLGRMIASGRSIPFIGSGMSCPTGMPTWAKFLRDTCKRTKDLKTIELDALLTSGDFEGAASRIFGDMPEQLFEERFEGNFTIRPSQAICGAVRLLPFLFESSVITTNFDEILETVYAGCDKSFKDVIHGMAVGDFRKRTARDSRCLLKLHGSYNVANGRVLLKNEYDGFYKPASVGREELAFVFRRGGLVFLGCSLQQDRTMALLKEVADSDKSMPRHYALLERPKTPKKTVEREHFLAERNIFPIWYDGDHDEDIEALLVGLMEELKKL